MLFTHELVGMLLPFLGKVSIVEMVAVKALMDSAVGAIKDGRVGRGKCPICTSLGGYSTWGRCVGVFDLGEVCITVILVFVIEHG